MATMGCIDNVVPNYDKFIKDVSLYPFTKDKKHFYDTIDDYPYMQWRVGYDIPAFADKDSKHLSPHSKTNLIFFNNIDEHHPYRKIYYDFFNMLFRVQFNSFVDKTHRINRIRVNLTNNIQSDTYLCPHVDSMNPHLTCSLMIGESDGDHIIFNERLDENYNPPQKLTIANQYKHKPNRLVWNTGHYHCNYTPSYHYYRLVVNVVYELH